MDSLCVKCKSRGFCGKKCKWINMDFKNFSFKKDFSGSAPSIFVGKANYPNVSIGFMSLPFTAVDANNFDSPKFFKNNLSIPQIINKRSLLINCQSAKKSDFEKIQEVALSKKAVEVEANLAKAPKPKIAFDFTSITMGPSSKLVDFSVNENVKMDKNVEKCFYDTDLKAAKALGILYQKGIDENSLSKYLSAGALGLKKNRVAVPTKWSITAVDDSIGKELINKVKNYKIINDYLLFEGSLFGNYYTILLLPGCFGYELFETMDGNDFMHDYEEYGGRKNYAFETAGGYYACRLAILEYLDKNKLQAMAIAYRRITPEYFAPLGVWVVREASRNAMESDAKIFGKNEFIARLDELNLLIFLEKKSVLFKNFFAQKRLVNY